MSDDQGDAVEASSEADEEASTSPDEGDDRDPVAAVAERAENDPASVAAELVALREEAAELETERDDLESRLKRKQAEFQNYKKRQEKQREKERARATEALVEKLLEVRDNLNRALEQDADADIREGVEATFRQLDDILDGEGVEAIEPDPGTETDPKRHEVLLQVESDEPEGTVAELHRPGYEMAGKVLRAAQVTVSEGPSEDSKAEDDDDGEDGDE